MALLLTVTAIAVGAGTYLYAKSKNAKNSTAAIAGVAGGAGTAAAGMAIAAAWPLLVIAGIIGIPAAGFYYLGKAKGQKALGRGRD